MALTTHAIKATMHVEPPTCRCEPVIVSVFRRGAGRVGGLIGPGHGGWVVDVQVAEDAWKELEQSI